MPLLAHPINKTPSTLANENTTHPNWVREQGDCQGPRPLTGSQSITNKIDSFGSRGATTELNLWVKRTK